MGAFENVFIHGRHGISIKRLMTSGEGKTMKKKRGVNRGGEKSYHGERDPGNKRREGLE